MSTSHDEDLLDLPSITVTAFGVAPYRVSFRAFVDDVVQDLDVAIYYAKNILEDGSDWNGAEESELYETYEAYDKDVLAKQLENVLQNQKA